MQPFVLAFTAAMLIQVLPNTVTADAPSTCPDQFMKVKNHPKCYFFGQNKATLTHPEAEAFCKTLGSNTHLVEFEDMDEFNDIVSAIKSLTTPYVSGPWLGMQMFKDGSTWSWRSSTTQTQTNDASFNKFVTDASKLSWKSDAICAGLNRFGDGFGFWSCGLQGSPLCEQTFSGDSA